MLKRLLLNTSANKILNFLTLHPETSFYDKEISERAGVSRGMTNRLLNEFLKIGLVSRERRGKMWFYFLNKTPLFKYYRIYENLVELTELVNTLKPFSQKIILYGSTASGEDTAESDIDLFILTEQKDKVLKEIRAFKTEREIKPVVQTVSEYVISKKKDKAFYEEVSKGITLFEKEINEQRL
jgi:predicted nucleotidyltransferase